MKKLFSTIAILASIVGLLYLVYSFLCDRFGCYDEEEDLYSEEFDDCDGDCVYCEGVIAEEAPAEETGEETAAEEENEQ